MQRTIPILVLMLCITTSGDAQTPVDHYGDALPEGAVARLGTVRFRHGDAAQHVGYALGGKVVASTGRNPGLALWDAETGRLLHRFSFPDNRFSGLFAFSPDGKKLVTGRHLIDVVSGKEIHQFKLPDVFFARSAFSSDGSMVAISVREKLVVFDAGTGHVVRPIDGSKTYISAIAFSPNDRNTLASSHADKVVRLWDATTGKQLYHLEGHATVVESIAFAPGGKVLAVGGRDGVIRLWTVATGKPLRQMPADTSDMKDIRSIVFSPDGKLLACTGFGGTITLWNPETGMKIRRWESNIYVCSSVAFEPKGKVLASAGPYSIRFWDIDTGKEINPSPGHSARIMSLKYLANDKALRSYDMDGVVVDWDLGSPGKIARRFGIPDAPTRTGFWTTRDIAPDGTVLAQIKTPFVGFKEERVIRLRDNYGGKEVKLVSGAKDSVAIGAAASFSPDGKLLASAGNDGVRLWNASSGKQIHHLHDIVNSSLLAFSPGGKLLATSGPDGRIHLCDVATGKKLQSWESGNEPLSRLLFSSDGKLLAASDRRMIRIWSAETGKGINQLNGTFQPSIIAFSANGRVLAASGGGAAEFGTDEYYQGGIHLWEVATGEPIRKINTTEAFATSLAFAPDGRSLASGSAGTILLWNLTGHGGVKPAPLTAADLEQLWDDLSQDAAKADRAHWRLALAPTQSLPFLNERARPVVPADAEIMKKLLADLDGQGFARRQKVEQKLTELGESAEFGLRKCLKENPSVELHRRIEQILSKRDYTLRKIRAIYAIEQIGNADARAGLEALAKGTPNPRVTQAAESALRRLGFRP